MRTTAWGVAALLFLLIGRGPARAEWLRAESPNFIVYGETTNARLREKVLLLEEFDRLLRFLTATSAPPSPNKLRVYLVRSLGEMRQIVPVGAGGFYLAGREAIFAVANENANWRDTENDILLHEYAHHFMLQYHAAAYPAWYVEGFAEYVATAEITPERIEYGNYRRNQAALIGDPANWFPYDEILFGQPGRVTPEHFYAQSWLLVHYLMADETRRAALVRYLQATARGDEPRAAFTAAFGMNAGQLQAALRPYTRRIAFRRLTRSGAQALPEIRIERIENAGVDAPLIEAALGAELTGERARALLQRARRAGSGDDLFGQRLRAHAEILHGDPAAADPLLDRLLAASPDNVQLLYLKGLRHLVAGRQDPVVRAAQFRLARGFFSRAHRADPNHVPTLFRYAESLSEGNQLLTENTQNILLLATSLAPQVIEIRVATAHLLLLRERYDEAQALLLPVSSGIHGRGPSARVEALLQAARARRRPADTDVFKRPDAPAESG